MALVNNSRETQRLMQQWNRGENAGVSRIPKITNSYTCGF